MTSAQAPLSGSFPRGRALVHQRALARRRIRLENGPRHILALLPEAETVVSCLQCALAAALHPEGTISAVYVGFDPGQGGFAPEEIAIQALREREEGTPSERAARVLAAFIKWSSLQPSKQRINWEHCEAGIKACVLKGAVSNELVVMGNPLHLDAKDALHTALFDTHRLILVAPRAPSPATRIIGRHIAVGWKPGGGIERATEAARPWLREAAEITIIRVTSTETKDDMETSDLFLPHGLNVKIHCAAAGTMSVGMRLLNEAMQLGADSLIMGAFRRGQLWENVFGGVTRDVLKNTNIPVFMMR